MLLASRQIHMSAWWYVAVTSIFILANAYGSIDVTSQFFIKTLFRGQAKNKTIAITFDDGPVPGKTEKVLDILDEYGVKATFFCIGLNARNNPQLLKVIHQRGHLLGNHSFFHGALFDLQSSARLKKELIDTDSVIFETTGQRPRYFRPPYGVTNPMLSRAVKQTGHLAIGWSMRSLDTVIDQKEKLMNRITKALKAGDILLLHDRCEVTVEILPELLHHIHQSGMTVEPLDKMLGEPAYV
jgi:peptidoglycan/xylan/chitin deacetylase (PgdA/CDA1 family)